MGEDTLASGTDFWIDLGEEYAAYAPELENLFRILCKAIPMPNDAGRIEVQFIPYADMAQAINDIVGGNAYTLGGGPHAIAIPASGEKANYYIVIDKSQLVAFEDPQQMGVLASSILEELIHVALYESRRHKHGLKIGEGTWEELVPTKVHDEYAALRIKSDIFMHRSPFYDPETGQPSPVTLTRPESLDELLVSLNEQVASIRQMIRGGEVGFGDIVPITNELTFRGVLDPFARDFGLWDGSNPDLNTGPSVSEGWRPYIGEEWDAILSELRKSHDSRYEASAEAIERIAPHCEEVSERMWNILRGLAPA